MEKVLVTGANGLLGSHIIRQLIRKGYAVKALVRKGSNLQALDGLNIEITTGQITSKQDVENAVKDCSYVIHSAARTSQSPSFLKAYIKPNVNSTLYIIEACRKYNILRLVYVSTANCFGNGSKTNPGTEKNPFMPWLKGSGYAYSKYMAQNRVVKETLENNFPAVVVNPTFLLGSNDIKPGSGQIFSHILNKKIVFFPPGGKNFVDAETAATGVINAMKNGKNGECYLLAGENLSYKEFFKLVGKTTGKRPLMIEIPRWVLLMSGLIGSFMEHYLKMDVRLTRANARMLCLGNYFVAQKAMNEINFQLTPAKDTIERAILWFQNNNYFAK